MGILVKNGFHMKELAGMNRYFDSFEFIDLLIKSDSSRDVRILVIYRPPSCNCLMFLDDFGSLLEQYITDSSFLLVAGDFNYCIDDAGDKASSGFCNLLGSLNLKQHVDKPTHSAGHILDLLITRDESLVLNISACDPALSDHFVVHCHILITKPSFERKEIEFRKLKTIDTEMICNKLANSSLLLHPPDNVHQLVALYNSLLASILDKHAPVKRRVITIRPAAPWYTEKIKTEKRKRRRLERRWRATRSASDREKFIRQCHAVNNMLSSSRLNYYSRLVTENRHDLRKLFSTFSKLLHQCPETRFPQHDSVTSLAHDFIVFFGNKIRNIREHLDRLTPDDVLEFRNAAAGCQFTTFANISLTELMTIVGSIYSKSCHLDPIPGCIVKDCFASVSSVITRIVNLSMESGILPTDLKVASVKPLLKKQSLSPDEFKNFRPISNLSFLSKVVRSVLPSSLLII